MPPHQTTKTRITVNPPISGITPYYYGLSLDNGVNYVNQGTTSPAVWNQGGVVETLTSTGHRGPPYKEGGPFRVDRYRIQRGVSKSFVDFTSGSILGYIKFRYKYDAPVICLGNYSLGACHDDHPLLLTEDILKTKYLAMGIPDRDLNQFGAQAVEKYSPLKPGANVGQALVELYRDGLPKLPTSLLRRTKDLKSVGSEFLNVEFGWKPLLKDLQDIYKTWNSLNSMMAQIIRDNGKPVRRRGTLYRNVESIAPVQTHTNPLPFQSLGAVGQADVNGEGYDKRGTWREITTSEKIWFSGQFRYHIPDVTDDRWSAQAKLALFGLNPTPSLLYQVMPWSWLIDWFANVGDVIDNLSSNGIADLIVDRCYVMRHFKRVTRYTSYTTPIIRDFSSYNAGILREPQATFITEVVEERKERAAASPFGFGLQIADLSDRQFAILTALGLSKQNFL